MIDTIFVNCVIFLRFIFVPQSLLHVRRSSIVWSPVSGTAALEITVMEAVSAEIRHCCLGCMWGIYQHYCALRTQGEVRGVHKGVIVRRGLIAPSERYIHCSGCPHGMETFVRRGGFHAGKPSDLPV